MNHRLGVRLAVFFALATGWSGGEVAAQERAFRGSGALYVGAGLSEIATGELNRRLAASSLPAVGRTVGTFGLGAYLLAPGGAMLGLEWHGISGGTEIQDDSESSLDGGFATLGAGYAVALSPRLRVYPRLGVGGGGMAVGLRRTGASIGFDEVLDDTGREPERGWRTSLSRGGAVVDLGAGLELLPAGAGRGTLLGLRAGYLLAPSDADWMLERRSVSGGPPASIGGPYFRVILGAAPAW